MQKGRWYGGYICAYRAGKLHIWKVIINGGSYTGYTGFIPTYAPIQIMFFRRWLQYFNKATPNHILHLLQQVLDSSACSPDLSLTENIWRIMEHKIQQRRTRTVEQLKSYIRQELDNISIPKVCNWSPQFPDV